MEKVVKEQYECFFHLHYGGLSLHPHTHSIHSKMAFLENTQKHSSFFCCIVCHIKAKNVVVILEMQDVNLYVGVIMQIVTVIMTSILVALIL